MDGANADLLKMRSETLRGASMKGAKVIFLDFDGVLNCTRSYFEERAWRDAGNEPRAETITHWLAPYNMAPLNRIIAVTQAKVVISSTWRLLYSPLELRTTLERFGFEGEIIGRTVEGRELAPGFYRTIHKSIPRGSEIAEWVNANSPRSFVILDDDGDMQAFLPRLVQTNPDEGLTEADADRAIELLLGRPRW